MAPSCNCRRRAYGLWDLMQLDARCGGLNQELQKHTCTVVPITWVSQQLHEVQHKPTKSQTMRFWQEHCASMRRLILVQLVTKMWHQRKQLPKGFSFNEAETYLDPSTRDLTWIPQPGILNAPRPERTSFQQRGVLCEASAFPTHSEDNLTLAYGWVFLAQTLYNRGPRADCCLCS